VELEILSHTSTHTRNDPPCTWQSRTDAKDGCSFIFLYRPKLFFAEQFGQLSTMTSADISLA
jgi:hypothetical protein